ncbi:MAG TPA: hypothetical protein VNZ58_04290 [Thermomicrobiales bacterium]|nr:hypothetical protein [Thermomicrobiales bacterium]
MFLIWPQTATTDPYEHQRNLEPGETRRRLARAKYEEEITMYTHLHLYDPAIKAKNANLIAQAQIAEQLRQARNGNSGPIATFATGIRRSIGSLLISAGERLQPAEIEPTCPDCPDTVMQA